MNIPFNRDREYFTSYRVTLRSQLSHPLLNSSFRIQCNEDKTVREAFLVYGLVSNHAIRAKNTEQFLVGKEFDEKTFAEAIDILRQEINPSNHPEKQYFTVSQPEGKETYRSNMVVHFFFKLFCKMRQNLNLPLSNEFVSINEESVCVGTSRPINHGQNDYEVGEG
jgi:xanthine dehydrogenase/oxidase